MAESGFTAAGVARLEEILDAHVAGGEVPGLAWAIARRGDVRRGVSGTTSIDGGAPLRPDAIFRISSMTKPVTTVAALILVEECRLRLDDPVDDLLPELADRRVLATPGSALDDTVPAMRPVTLRHLLTFTLGLGMDFTAAEPPATLVAAAELGLGAGPPAPARLPDPDEWMRRVGTLPLQHQPGERWLYHTGAEVLGVLVARAAGQPLGTFLQERIFEPLGMRDTGFSVPESSLDRFGPCYWMEPPELYDPPDGQWSSPPAFPGGGDGLVSSVDDYLVFAQMLLGGGTARGVRILARPTVEAMTTNQLTDEQLRTGPDPTGATGWGFGVGVCVRGVNPARGVGAYGWDGGLGSTWSNDPGEELVGILLTNRAFASPALPAPFQDFWTATYAAVAG